VITLPIPKPISVNNIFVNRGRSRVKSERYRVWRNAAEWTVKAAGPITSIAGPVDVTLYITEVGVSPRMDIDNTAKAYIDLLVRLGVIKDDSRRILRALSLRWTAQAQGWAIIEPHKGE